MLNLYFINFRKISLIFFFVLILIPLKADNTLYNDCSFKTLTIYYQMKGPFTLSWWKFRARVKKLFTGKSEIKVRWNVRHQNYEKKTFNPLYKRKA